MLYRLNLLTELLTNVTVSPQAGDPHDAGDLPHAAARGGPEHQAAATGSHRPLPVQSHRATATRRRHRG